MAVQGDSPAHIGVSLGPDRSHAVVVGDRTVLASLSVAGPDPTALLARAAASCPGRPLSVVVDVSRLLLTHILHRTAGLSPVAMIRIVPRPASEPALARHPADVIERLITRRHTIPGGHDLFGQELRPIDPAAVRSVCAEIARDGVSCVSIVASGSSAQPRQERVVADAVQAVLPDAHISLAAEFGSQGLLAREATVVLNAALYAVTEEILAGCGRAMHRALPGVPWHVGRGDGGWASPSRIGRLPVIGVGAADALQLLGAARLAGSDDCRVLLDRPSGPVVGDVRHGLVVVRPQETTGLGTVLVVPTATLTPSPTPAPAPAWRTSDVALVRADLTCDELTCVGAAVSRPTAWLDEIAFIESTSELDRVRQDAAARATAIATANGAAPGSADIVEVSTVALPYSPSGTVRVRVRVAGKLDEPVPVESR
jgi:hypothetical protein